MATNATMASFPKVRNLLFMPILYSTFFLFAMLRSKMLSRILLLILLAIVLFASFFTGRAVFRYTRVQEDIASAREEVARLGERNALLTMQLGGEEDTHALELEAKRRLNVKRPEEKVVIIVPGNEESIIAEALREQGIVPEGQPQGFFTRLKEWLLDNAK